MLNRLGSQVQSPYLLMDRAYEGNETRQLALALGFTPVVPPLSTRVHPWEYDREMYKRRNEIERLFRRLKGFRRIFSRFEKLDVIFLGFISFALIFDCYALCEQALVKSSATSSCLILSFPTNDPQYGSNAVDGGHDQPLTVFRGVLQLSGKQFALRAGIRCRNPVLSSHWK